jgi:hypothetical protein
MACAVHTCRHTTQLTSKLPKNNVGAQSGSECSNFIHVALTPFSWTPTPSTVCTAVGGVLVDTHTQNNKPQCVYLVL